MTFSFQQFSDLKEAVSTVTRDEFLDAMKSVYDSGDERLVRRITELGADIQIDEVIARVFKNKAPKADPGSDATLANKIKALGITPSEKVELAYAIEDGSAYDMFKMMNGSVGASKPISSCLTGVKGADDLLEWYVAWRAKTDSSALAAGASEVWIITAGKGGTTPAKGDAQLGNIKVEVKSDKGKGFSGEFSVQGKQNTFEIPVGLFRSELAKLFAKKKITVKDDGEYGLGSRKGKGKISGAVGKSVEAALNKTIDILMKEGKMKATAIDAEFQKMIKASFPVAKNKTISVMDKDRINVKKFFHLWTACAFEEYADREEFEYCVMFDRSSKLVRTFKSGNDILALGDNFNCSALTYSSGAGQNSSLAQFSFK
mgnify:CR=1 FL=1